MGPLRVYGALYGVWGPIGYMGPLGCMVPLGRMARKTATLSESLM